MKSAPPKIAGTRAPFVTIILAATLAAIAAVIFFNNPANHAYYPVCQFHRLTGLNCPGCGMTRALYALLHGQVLLALHDNALFVLSLLALVVRTAWFGWNQHRRRPPAEFFPLKFLWPLLALALLFTILRNLPAFAFLSP
jgi:hypothetical protein